MILGVDYGTKKIGLALGDQETNIAIPWRVIKHVSREKTIAYLKELVVEQHITHMVIGIPLSSSGEDTAQTTITRKFIISVQKSIFLPIETENEFYSTKEAREKLQEAGIKKYTVDAHSAAIILQSWLDKNSAKGISLILI